jgi:hypothetical protein
LGKPSMSQHDRDLVLIMSCAVSIGTLKASRAAPT